MEKVVPRDSRVHQNFGKGRSLGIRSAQIVQRNGLHRASLRRFEQDRAHFARFSQDFWTRAEIRDSRSGKGRRNDRQSQRPRQTHSSNLKNIMRINFLLH